MRSTWWLVSKIKFERVNLLRLQVASKYMPQASIKIGVDLDKIPPIKGVVTFQSDITTAKCMAQIKKELKHF